jgi:hypothetical protein
MRNRRRKIDLERGTTAAQGLFIFQPRTKRKNPMKTLSLTKETIQVLQSDDLDGVLGGIGRVSSALNPTATAVSSAKPSPGTFVKPTATAVSSARPSPAKPTSSAIHHNPVSSVRPGGGSLSSAIRWF